MTYVLVTYASKHNSTAEIAHAIADVLGQSESLKVDFRPVEAVKDITPYDAVILGSAVYAGQWQSSAVEFLKNQETALSQRTVWLFSSGPTGEGDPIGLLKGWKFPEALEPLITRIAPCDVAVFHGNLDPTKLSLFERSVVKMVHAPTGDFRDWIAIQRWANSIARAL